MAKFHIHECKYTNKKYLTSWFCWLKQGYTENIRYSLNKKAINTLKWFVWIFICFEIMFYILCLYPIVALFLFYIITPGIYSIS